MSGGCLHRVGQPRRCKRHGCKTWLSSYNRDPYCASHGGWRAQKEALKSKERGEDLADVLAVA